MRFSWSTFRLALTWFSLGVLSVIAGWWNAERHRDHLLDEIKSIAARCAVAFITDDVAALEGARSDLGTRPYLAVKDRLHRLQAVDPAVRFLYLFRSTEQPGRVIFLADSEPIGAPEESQPGDDYPEALMSPGLQAILRDGRPVTEGPLRDSFGEWFTAYALVATPPGAPRILLGVDVDASTWRHEIWREGLIGAGYVWLLIGFPLGVWHVVRRERRFNREIVRFSAAIQQSHSGILITDLRRCIEYANTGCSAATGYTMAELLGQPARYLLPRDMDEHLRTQIISLVLAGERWQGELQIRRQNGEVFPARTVISPVRDGSGRVVNLVMVFDDITDVKRAAEELRIARDQAQSADRAKGEFLAVMSHELRTPLNGIIGFASLLGDTPLSPEQKDYAETIRRSGEALLALTNELLDYSRIDAGRLSLDPQPCSPRQVVEEAVELLSARAAEKNLELITTIASGIPAHVQADPGRLRQVLVNLVGNAIKFTPAGEVEVTLEAQPEQSVEGEPRVRLVFTVRDTGVGIASELQERLFVPFSQLEPSNTRKHGGAGLGLAISRSIVRLMEGDIEVSSAAGAGSVFRFHILVPVLEPATPLDPLPAFRVALVSANTRARRHYASLLERWGLVVEARENLPALGAELKHDVIVVDILARDAELWPTLLRNHAGLAGRVVVGLAPVSITAAVRDELRGSFRALLKKPVREPLLHAVLKSLLRG